MSRVPATARRVPWRIVASGTMRGPGRDDPASGGRPRRGVRFHTPRVPLKRHAGSVAQSRGRLDPAERKLIRRDLGDGATPPEPLRAPAAAARRSHRPDMAASCLRGQAYAQVRRDGIASLAMTRPNGWRATAVAGRGCRRPRVGALGPWLSGDDASPRRPPKRPALAAAGASDHRRHSVGRLRARDGGQDRRGNRAASRRRRWCSCATDFGPARHAPPALAGLLGAVGTNTSTPAVGLAAAIGVESRPVAYAVALLFVLLAFFPKLTALLAIMPRPVMVAALLFTATFIIIAVHQRRAQASPR